MDDELAVCDANERVPLTNCNVGPVDSLLTGFLLDSHYYCRVEAIEEKGEAERGREGGRWRWRKLRLGSAEALGISQGRLFVHTRWRARLIPRPRTTSYLLF